MSYADKLKDPRWQKKRLEILSRDNFTCQYCNDTEKTLHVHHKMYLRNRDVWDYDDRLLVTFCEDCHKYQHDDKKEYESLLLETLYMKGFSYDNLRELAFSFHKHSQVIKYDIILMSLGYLLSDKESVDSLIEHYFGKDRIDTLKKEFADGTT